MGPTFAEGITVEKKADATYKVVGAGVYHLMNAFNLYLL